MATNDHGDHRIRRGWDGDPATYPDFMRRVRLSFERTPRKKVHLLGPEVVAQLSGRPGEEGRRLYRFPVYFEEEPQGEDDADEGETVGPPEDDRDELLADEKDKESDSDDSTRALEDLALWERYDETLPDVLPSEVLGWLLLRRSGISHQASLAVQSAASNSLRLDDVEKSLRAMEDEILGQELRPRGGHGSGGKGGNRPRTYWVEENGEWAMWLGESGDLDELFDGGEIHYVGKKLPSQVHPEPYVSSDYYEDWTYYNSEWGPYYDEWEAEDFASSWWYEDLPPEQHKELEEAYALLDQKARNFVEARQAVKERAMARLLLHRLPQCLLATSGMGSSGDDGSGFLGAAVGDAGYTGCFICGNKNHDFRHCPKRQNKGSNKGAVHFASDVGTIYQVMDTTTSTPPSSTIYAIEEHHPDDEIFSSETEDLSGYAVLDSGATETVASLPALEALMGVRRSMSPSSSASSFQVLDQPPKRFKFGNGEFAASSSFVLLPQRIGDHQVELGVYTLDVVGVPVLIGIKTMMRLHAIVDFAHCRAVFAAVDAGLVVPLKRSRSGHLLVSLKDNWLQQGHRLDAMTAQPDMNPLLSKGGPASSFMVQSAVEPVGQDSEAVLEGCESQISDHDAPAAAKSRGPKKQADPLDEERTEGPDLRDPRAKGSPCYGNHRVAKAYKGSVSGANQFGSWTGCEVCKIRLSYTPRMGCHGIHRKSAPLARDVQEIHQSLPPETEVYPSNREISLTAAENSALARLESLRRLRKGSGKTNNLTSEVPSKDKNTGDPSKTEDQSSKNTGDPSKTGVSFVKSSVSGNDCGGPRRAADSPQQEGIATESTECRETGARAVNDHPREEAHVLSLMNTSEVEGLATNLQTHGSFDYASMERLIGLMQPKTVRPGRQATVKERKFGFTMVFGLYAHGSYYGCTRFHWTSLALMVNMKGAMHLESCGLNSVMVILLIPLSLYPGGKSLEVLKFQDKFILPAYFIDYQFDGPRVSHLLAQYVEFEDGLKEIFFQYPNNQTTNVAHLCSPRLEPLDMEQTLQREEWTYQVLSHGEGCDLSNNLGFHKARERLSLLKPEWLWCHVPRGPSTLFREDGAWLDFKQAAKAKRYLKGRNVREVQRFWKHHGKGPPINPVDGSGYSFPVDTSCLETLTTSELERLMQHVHQLHRRFGHPSNRLLVKNLLHRNADEKVVAAASKLECDECLESQIKMPSPAVNLDNCEKLWSCLQVDGFHLRCGDTVMHFLLMVDEASGFAVIREMFSHPEENHRNMTGPEVVQVLQEAWFQYFGYPETLKLDLEGIDLVPAPAEYHEMIADVEREIGYVRQRLERFLRGGAFEKPGRDMSLGNRALEAVGAEQSFLKHRADQLASRAKNAKVRTQVRFFPGDLIFYRRYKTPADLPANSWVDRPRLRGARWYGPGRVLACETKVEEGHRKPSQYIWAICSGRLKKFHSTQLRHASPSERLTHEALRDITMPWTMTSLTRLLDKGAYDDETRSRAARHFQLGRKKRGFHRRAPGAQPHALPPSGPQGLPPSPSELLEFPSDEEMIPDSSMRKAPRLREPETQGVASSDSVDVHRLLHDPRYMPTSSASSFQEQRRLHEQDDRPWHVQHGELHYAEEEAELGIYSVILDMPANDKEWKKVLKDPRKFLAKSVQKGVEVSWNRLDETQRAAMTEAKQAEVASWISNKVVKAALPHISREQALRMRWIYTFKAAEPGKVKAKARMVILGYSDPSLLDQETSSPAMSRQSKMLFFNYATARRWRVLAGDVKTAFLQAKAPDRQHPLYAQPLPELAAAMNLTEEQMVELLGSAYGLTSAPREWFQDLTTTLRKLNAVPCVSDPCIWRLFDSAGTKVIALIGLYVDDILFCGDEGDQLYCTFLHELHQAYAWSPWEADNFSHCGVRVQQFADASILLDHSEYCTELVQMPARAKGDDSELSVQELSQARAILGSIQWRASQTAPQHSAKVSYLLSMLATKRGEVVDMVNKLVREVHSSRHVILRKWSCHLFGLMNPDEFRRGQGRINAITWKSGRLQRVARSSLSAETQALADLDGDMMYARLTWAEMNGSRGDLKDKNDWIRSVPSTMVIDARALYDALDRGDLTISNMKDKFSALETLALAQSMTLLGTQLQWTDSDHQLADGLTKVQKQDTLKRFLSSGAPLAEALATGASSGRNVGPLMRMMLTLDSNCRKTRSKCAFTWQSQVSHGPAGDVATSYEDLAEKAVKAARWLLEHQIRSGPVAVWMPRSETAGSPAGRSGDIEPLVVVSALAILMVGGVYVPCDDRLPWQRVEHMVEDAGVILILAGPQQLQLIPSSIPAVDGSKLLETEQDARDGVLPSSIDCDELAYVIFTSGSTGKPKGVAVTHRSIVHLIDWVNSTFNVTQTDALLFTTSIGFDLSCYDIFGSLSAGSTIHFWNGSAASPDQLFEIVVSERISFWDSAPQVLQQLEPRLAEAALRDLRLVFLSGDWVPISLVQTLHRVSGASVVALGGATEVTVWSNYFEVPLIDGDWPSIPYGRPIWNHQYYCLGQSGPLHVGTTGELYIGGVGVAQGYVGRPDLTAERFLTNSFHSGRMYRTGDMVRFMPLKPWGDPSRLQQFTASDVVLEFLGRIDSQVKVRGYRVELAEVELAFLKQPGIEATTVLALPSG
ncbi:bacA, partial [Symbiodinium necroappetens]